MDRRDPDRLETISAWAEAPWVIAVGGTEDEAGTRPASYSPVGTRGVPESGPDLLAYGGNSENGVSHEGTSYAAPRVTLEIMKLCAFLELTGFSMRTIAGHREQAIPPIGYATVDHGFLDFEWERVSADGLVGQGINLDHLADAVRKMTAMQVELDWSATPDRLRALLYATARALPLPAHIGGRGFVGPAETRGFLEHFSAAQFAWVCGGRRIDSGSLPSLEALELVEIDDARSEATNRGRHESERLPTESPRSSS
jgi:hypothetical protein